MFEDEQLNTKLLLGHVQESGQLGHGHGGVQLQEATMTHCDLDDVYRQLTTTAESTLFFKVFLKGQMGGQKKEVGEEFNTFPTPKQ